MRIKSRRCLLFFAVSNDAVVGQVARATAISSRHDDCGRQRTTILFTLITTCCVCHSSHTRSDPNYIRTCTDQPTVETKPQTVRNPTARAKHYLDATQHRCACHSKQKNQRATATRESRKKQHRTKRSKTTKRNHCSRHHTIIIQEGVHTYTCIGNGASPRQSMLCNLFDTTQHVASAAGHRQKGGETNQWRWVSEKSDHCLLRAQRLGLVSLPTTSTTPNSQTRTHARSLSRRTRRPGSNPPTVCSDVCVCV